MTARATPWTPGPWSYVASTEHHGPYVTSEFGSDICDCYEMSRPSEFSTLNGGDSRPIHYMAEFADPNARLIAEAPAMADLLAEAEQAISDCLEHRSHLHYETRTKIGALLARIGSV